MSIIIRLQNLPWAADSGDIRRYFSGLSIPEGGVHIVGGEMGDAFIAFSTDEDARLAMAKDGGKIHEMQIKLLLSSRQEMARVIERARQQNLSLQSSQIIPPLQPPPFPAITQLQQPIRVPVEMERRRGRSPTPPRRRSRDRVDSRDRRRSPDNRRSSSKRDRSRSPSRSSRGSSRDMDSRDRRSFKRDDRRYSNEESTRYSDDRHSDRHRYSDVDHSNSRPFSESYQEPSNQGFYNYQDQNITQSSSSTFLYGNNLNNATTKDYPVTSNTPSNYSYSTAGISVVSNTMPPITQNSNVYSYNSQLLSNNSPKSYSHSFYSNTAGEKSSLVTATDSFSLDKGNIAMMLNQVNASSSYMKQSNSYNTVPFEDPANAPKATTSISTSPTPERKRKSRFEPEPALKPPFIQIPDVFQKLGVQLDSNRMQSDSIVQEKKHTQIYQPVAGEEWILQNRHLNENKWVNKQSASDLQNQTDSNKGVIPMDLDPPQDSPSDSSFVTQNEYPSKPNVSSGTDMLLRNDAQRSVPVKEADRNQWRTPKTLGTDMLSRNDGQRSVPVKEIAADRNQWRTPKTLAVEVKKLPSETRMEDLLHIFQNIPLTPNNVCILINNQRAEKAFLKFSCNLDFEKAMNLQPIFIRNSQCELVPCPVSVFENAVASQVSTTKPRPKMKPKEEDLILQLKGLPFQCSEHDVVQFFDGLRILDIFVELLPDGRCSGIGFVEFATIKDFKEALTLNGKTIGRRYITLSVASKEILEFNREGNGVSHNIPPRGPPPPPRGPPSAPRGPPSAPRGPPSAPRGLPSAPRGPPSAPRGPPSAPRGLPSAPRGHPSVPRAPLQSKRAPSPPANHNFNNPHHFNEANEPPFKEQKMVPSLPSTKPMRGNFCVAIRGLPKSVTNTNLGNYFKEIDVTALGVHVIVDSAEGPTGEAYVEVATQQEMDLAINKAGRLFHGCRLNMMPFPMEELDVIIGRSPPPSSNPTGPLLRTPVDTELPPRRPLLPQGPTGVSFRPLDFSQNEPLRGPGPVRGARPPMNRPIRPPFERPMRPPFPRMRGPRPDVPRGDIIRPSKNFGAPGCVVSINNLHFSAGLEELLTFFQDFNITKDNIIRRYNENKQPTGEARVAFPNPREAQRAVRELNMKPIMRRSLHLSIL